MHQIADMDKHSAKLALRQAQASRQHQRAPGMGGKTGGEMMGCKETSANVAQLAPRYRNAQALNWLAGCCAGCQLHRGGCQHEIPDHFQTES